MVRTYRPLKASTALTAGIASLAKSVLEHHGGFLYVRLYGDDIVALFLEEREKPTRYCAYAEPEVVLRGR